MIEIIKKNLDIILVFLFLFLVAWNVWLELKLRRERSRTTHFFKGKKAEDLESVLSELFKKQKSTDERMQKALSKIKFLDKSALQSVQKVGLIRFNPFSDLGSNQSFSVAFLDQKDDGVVISSLHAKEGTRIYAKPIKHGESEYPLSKEEDEAIKKSLK
jgi:hypothetical protein